jgi:chemotaxis protein CheD
MKMGGMNHFLYPLKKIGDQPRSIFGDVSTKALINMFLKSGSKKEDLEAQIFGGAYNAEYSSTDIGKENIESAKEVLKNKKIKIASSDTGGGKGRKIIFDTSTNEIVIIRVDKLRQTDWFPYK